MKKLIIFILLFNIINTSFAFTEDLKQNYIKKIDKLNTENSELKLDYSKNWKYLCLNWSSFWELSETTQKIRLWEYFSKSYDCSVSFPMILWKNYVLTTTESGDKKVIHNWKEILELKNIKTSNLWVISSLSKYKNHTLSYVGFLEWWENDENKFSKEIWFYIDWKKVADLKYLQKIVPNKKTLYINYDIDKIFLKEYNLDTNFYNITNTLPFTIKYNEQLSEKNLTKVNDFLKIISKLSFEKKTKLLEKLLKIRNNLWENKNNFTEKEKLKFLVIDYLYSELKIEELKK